MGDYKGTLKFEYDFISIKTTLFITHFGSTFGFLRFDEKFFIINFLGFTQYWDYRPTNAIHADSPGVYTSDKNLYLSTVNKIPLNCH